MLLLPFIIPIVRQKRFNEEAEAFKKSFGRIMKDLSKYKIAGGGIRVAAIGDNPLGRESIIPFERLREFIKYMKN